MAHRSPARPSSSSEVPLDAINGVVTSEGATRSVGRELRGSGTPDSACGEMICRIPAAIAALIKSDGGGTGTEGGPTGANIHDHGGFLLAFYNRPLDDRDAE